MLPANLRLVLACRSEVARQSAAAVLQSKGYTIKPVPRLAEVDPSNLLSSLVMRRGVQLSPKDVSTVLSKRFVDRSGL